MSPEQALRDIKGYTAAGRVKLSWHVLERMKKRNIKRDDIHHVLTTAETCIEQEGTWKVEGTDLDDDELTVIVALEDGVVVVTAF